MGCVSATPHIGDAGRQRIANVINKVERELLILNLARKCSGSTIDRDTTERVPVTDRKVSLIAVSLDVSRGAPQKHDAFSIEICKGTIRRASLADDKARLRTNHAKAFQWKVCAPQAGDFAQRNLPAVSHRMPQS